MPQWLLITRCTGTLVFTPLAVRFAMRTSVPSLDKSHSGEVVVVAHQMQGVLSSVRSASHVGGAAAARAGSGAARVHQ